MKKRISLSIIVTLLVATAITTVFAVEGLRFSIEESKTLATTNSKQADIDDLDIKAKESALEDAEKDAKMSTGGNSQTDILNNKIKRDVNPAKAQADLEYAKKNKEKNAKVLNLDVYKTTSNILLLQKELNKEKGKLDILKEKYSIAEVRYKEGKVTENDLYDAKYAIDSKNIDINKLTKKFETSDLELKRLLGLTMDDDLIEVRDDLVLASTDDIDIEKVVENALSSDADVYMKSEEFKASDKTMEITKEYFEQGTTAYDENALNLENAKAGMEDSKANLEVAIRNKYNDILTAKDKVELAKKWEGINKTKLDNAGFKYEKGIIGREELLNVKEQYLDAQYQTYLEIYNFNVLKCEFDTLYVK